MLCYCVLMQTDAAIVASTRNTHLLNCCWVKFNDSANCWMREKCWIWQVRSENYIVEVFRSFLIEETNFQEFKPFGCVLTEGCWKSALRGIYNFYFPFVYTFLNAQYCFEVCYDRLKSMWPISKVKYKNVSYQVLQGCAFFSKDVCLPPSSSLPCS